MLASAKCLVVGPGGFQGLRGYLLGIGFKATFFGTLLPIPVLTPQTNARMAGQQETSLGVPKTVPFSPGTKAILGQFIHSTLMVTAGSLGDQDLLLPQVASQLQPHLVPTWGD